MTAAEVKKRVDALFAPSQTKRDPEHRQADCDDLVADVLRAISKSSITRSTTRALAEELLRLFP